MTRRTEERGGEEEDERGGGGGMEGRRKECNATQRIGMPRKRNAMRCNATHYDATQRSRIQEFHTIGQEGLGEEHGHQTILFTCCFWSGRPRNIAISNLVCCVLVSGVSQNFMAIFVDL